MARMASLQIRLQTGFDGDRERRFYEHALTGLITDSGSQVEIEDWTITSDQVEFGQEIGCGGLYVFALWRSILCIRLWWLLLAGKSSRGVGTGRMSRSKCSQ